MNLNTTTQRVGRFELELQDCGEDQYGGRDWSLVAREYEDGELSFNIQHSVNILLASGYISDQGIIAYLNHEEGDDWVLGGTPDKEAN